MRRLRYVQRLVLGTFLNGDLQDNAAVHTWVVELAPDRDRILEMFRLYVVPCLIPCKVYMFPRQRWTNTELSIDYFGLLCSHHNLLEPTVQQWISLNIKPQDSFAPSAFSGSKQFLGWGSVLQDALQDKPLHDPDPDDADEEPDQPQQHDQDKTEATDAKEHWIKMRKQSRKKFRMWADANPGPKLVALRTATTPVVTFTHKLLSRSGDTWERKQELKTVRGEQRTFRALEAFRGTDLNAFFADLNHAFHSRMEALAERDMIRNNQVLTFQMLSAVGAGIDFYIGLRWRSYPVRLFGLLDDHPDPEAVQFPCLLDEFSQHLLEQFDKAGGALSEFAKHSMTCLAMTFTMGIAEIEARHASTRRIVTVKGVQTHMPSLDDISANWVCRRNAIMRSEYPSSPPTSPRVQKSADSANKTWKKPGGPWRAFVSEQLQGQRRFTKDDMNELSAKYQNLSPDEFNYFKELGECAKQAGKAGFQPFGEATSSKRARSAEPNASLQAALVPVQDLDQFGAQLQTLKQRLRMASREEAGLQRQAEIELQAASQQQQLPHHESALQAWSTGSSVRGLPSASSSLHCARVHPPADVCAEAGQL